MLDFKSILLSFNVWKKEIYSENVNLVKAGYDNYKLICNRAYENIPFWKNLYNQEETDKENNTVTNKSIISLFTSDHLSENIMKDELKEHMIKAPSHPFNNKYQIFLSAGKNGKLTFFLYDAKMWHEYILFFLKLMYIGKYNFSENSKIAFVGTSDKKHTQYRVAKEFPQNQVGIFGLQQSIENYINEIENFKPNVIIGYSSAVVLAAKYTSDKIKPKCVLTSTDYLSEENKKLIIDKWDISPLSIFTMTEAGILAFECTEGNYHLNEEHIYLKNINKIQTFTNVINNIQPFIHYELPSIIKLSDNLCSCNLPYQVIAIEGKGRENKILCLEKDNKNLLIHPIAIRSSLDTIPNLKSNNIQVKNNKLLITIEGKVDKNIAKKSLMRMLKKMYHNINKDDIIIKII